MRALESESWTEGESQSHVNSWATLENPPSRAPFLLCPGQKRYPQSSALFVQIKREKVRTVNTQTSSYFNL